MDPKFIYNLSLKTNGSSNTFLLKIPESVLKKMRTIILRGQKFPEELDKFSCCKENPKISLIEIPSENVDLLISFLECLNDIITEEQKEKDFVKKYPKQSLDLVTLFLDKDVILKTLQKNHLCII